MFIHRLVFGTLLLGFLITLCGAPAPEADDDPADPAEPATPPSTIRIEAVEYARTVDERFELVGGAVTSFFPDEPVSARIRIDGRPRSGQVTMRWMWRDLPLGEVALDLGDTNGGMLFSFGQDTMVRVTFTPNDVSYIGNSHRIVVLYAGAEVGSYPIRIAPREGAIPSRYHSAQLYRRFDPASGPSEPTTTFAPGETVNLVGTATVGSLSWLDVVWTVNGQVAPELARTIVARENRDPLPFIFVGAPPGGAWPVGTHSAAVRVDDVDAGTFTFTVAAPTP